MDKQNIYQYIAHGVAIFSPNGGILRIEFPWKSGLRPAMRWVLYYQAVGIGDGMAVDEGKGLELWVTATGSRETKANPSKSRKKQEILCLLNFSTQTAGGSTY